MFLGDQLGWIVGLIATSVAVAWVGSRVLLWALLWTARLEFSFEPPQAVETVPGWWSTLVEPTLVALETRGFVRALWTATSDGSGQSVPGALLHDRSREMFVHVGPTLDDEPEGPISVAVMTIERDRILRTIGRRAFLDAPPFASVGLPGASIDELLNHHRSRQTGGAAALEPNAFLAANGRALSAAVAGVEARGEVVRLASGLGYSAATAFALARRHLYGARQAQPRVVADDSIDLDLYRTASLRAAPPPHAARATSVGIMLLALLVAGISLFLPLFGAAVGIVVAIRELGQTLARRALGQRRSRPFFWPRVGGIGIDEPRAYDLPVLLAGVGLNVLVGAALLAFTVVHGSNDFLVQVLFAQGVLLLPVSGLDGARIVERVLWLRWPELAWPSIVGAGLVVSVVFVLTGGPAALVFVAIVTVTAWPRIRETRTSMARLSAVRRAHLAQPERPVARVALEVLRSLPGPRPASLQRLALVTAAEAMAAAQTRPVLVPGLALIAHLGFWAASVAYFVAGPLGDGPTFEPMVASAFVVPREDSKPWPAAFESAFAESSPENDRLRLLCILSEGAPAVAPLMGHVALPAELQRRATPPWVRLPEPEAARARATWAKLETWRAQLLQAMLEELGERRSWYRMIGASLGFGGIPVANEALARRQEIDRAMDARIAREASDLDSTVVTLWLRATRTSTNADRSWSSALAPLVGAATSSATPFMVAYPRLDDDTLALYAPKVSSSSDAHALVEYVRGLGCSDVRLELLVP